MNKNNICNNCGKYGHQFHQCKMPITSYGIVLFRYFNNTLQFLMIRRKDSFGYIDFIRGKYLQNNLEHLQSIFNEMTIEERLRVKNNNFTTLWNEMWGFQEKNNQFKGEELASQKKFEMLRQGVPMGATNDIVTMDELIDKATTKWKETEWEFPKGRRNYQEKDIDCALREFEEETGISKKNIIIVENIMPFEEIFLGSNHKPYKHKYFLGYINVNQDNQDNQDKLDNFQITEVSKLEWKTFDNCIESIRPYHLEKKQMLININKVLSDYKLY